MAEQSFIGRVLQKNCNLRPVLWSVSEAGCYMVFGWILLVLVF